MRSAAAVHRRWSGLGFVLLLLTSAGMATVPGGADSVPVVREFYGSHRQVVVTAQVIGILAAVVFLVFTASLERGLLGHPARGVRRAGRAVAAAGVLVAVPVLALCGVAEQASDQAVHRLAVASDLTDVVLFAAVAWFSFEVGRGLTHVWARGVVWSVSALAAARAVLLLSGSDLLGLVAPLAFVALVVALSLARRSAPAGATPMTRGAAPLVASHPDTSHLRGRGAHASGRPHPTDGVGHVAGPSISKEKT